MDVRAVLLKFKNITVKTGMIFSFSLSLSFILLFRLYFHLYFVWNMQLLVSVRGKNCSGYRVTRCHPSLWFFISYLFERVAIFIALATIAEKYWNVRVLRHFAKCVLGDRVKIDFLQWTSQIFYCVPITKLLILLHPSIIQIFFYYIFNYHPLKRLVFS